MKSETRMGGRRQRRPRDYPNYGVGVGPVFSCTW
jgi:hypothetical protein